MMIDEQMSRVSLRFSIDFGMTIRLETIHLAIKYREETLLQQAPFQHLARNVKE